jgi:hypothetical protein
MQDAKLLANLKQAIASKMFFAFIQTKDMDGILIVSRVKISQHEILRAKREMGVRTVVTGTCFGHSSNMVFQVNKEVSGLAKLLMKVVKQDAGLTIKVNVQLAGDV